ncbi:MAG: Txe/YoeB family addiction module toxin [Pseudonocardiaceae bacterium]
MAHQAVAHLAAAPAGSRAPRWRLTRCTGSPLPGQSGTAHRDRRWLAATGRLAGTCPGLRETGRHVRALRDQPSRALRGDGYPRPAPVRRLRSRRRPGPAAAQRRERRTRPRRLGDGARPREPATGRPGGARTGNEGTGKPEAPRYAFQGYWSRRITDEHRLVYRVVEDEIRIAACRYHYSR